jgi:hypothetical protein
LITIGLIVWQHAGMNHATSIDTGNNNHIYLRNDNINGGHSIGKLFIEEQKARLECVTKSSRTFAFCSIIIPTLSNEGAGLDLNRFNTMSLTINFDSKVRDTILVYLINKEAQPNGKSLIRSNMHTINPAAQSKDFQLTLDSFFVPSWWIFSQPLTNASSDTRFDNVIEIQIATGDNTQPRKVEIEVSNISFQGKWISAQNLYLALLVIWISIISVHGGFSLIQFRKQYQMAIKERIELARLNNFLSIERDKFESMAQHDSLTGCLNRAGIRDILREQLHYYSTAGTEVSLILLDIDYFKKVNDTYGHDIGDAVLVSLTKRIATHIREDDYLARWGGEEFAIICTKTSL